MAKYTELFAEYVRDGGALPSSSFALVEDFEDLFKERYCACEIGFETEELFAMKLDMKARLVMPLYAKRIAAVDAAMNKLQTPLKVRSESRVYGAQHSKTTNGTTNKETNTTQNNKEGSSNVQQSGSVNESVTELPFDTTTATPSKTSFSSSSETTTASTSEEATGSTSIEGNTTANGSADFDEHEDNFTYTDFVTIDENLRILETLSSNRKGLIEECLNEFKPLFMGVY